MRTDEEQAYVRVAKARRAEGATLQAIANELHELGHRSRIQAPMVVNDRVRRQACFQAVLVRSIALSVTTSLRMQAVNASLAGFPASRSRR